MNCKKKLIDIFKTQIGSGMRFRIDIKCVAMFRDNGFSEEELIEACDYLCLYKCPSHMNLSENKLGNFGLRIFSRCFKNELSQLILQFNNITDEGIEYLSKSECKNLTYLDLTFNCIRNTDNLAQLLLNFPKLNFLNLNNNNINLDGLEQIAKALEHHSNLETLMMHGNDIEEDDISDKKIASFLQKNKSIELITLGKQLRTEYQYPKTRAITDRNCRFKKIDMPLYQRLLSEYEKFET